jgi:hypothetical protein
VKRKRLLSGLTILIAVLAIGIAIAIVPPPPANQDMGVYDTVFGEFAEDDCRECHSSGLPDRHHMLVEDGEYECLDCHPVGPGGHGVTIIRDCTNSSCHTSTPHHDTQDALARNCSHCHGSLVDDYDDGHYIPPYPPSLVTPDTSYNVINATTGKKWGGCEACHEANTTPVPGPAIYGNYETHHNLGSVTANCSWCHNTTGGELLDIRKCEECHGVNSLHNIQYDYANTEGDLGYGHLGDNWDCMGCHAWYEYASAPQTGPIIPCIDGVSPARLVAGEQTVVTVTGTNFRNTVGDTAYTSDVVIETGAGTITLTPDSITASELVVTVPALDEGTGGLHVVKRGIKSDMKSKMAPIVVAPPVSIDSATIKKDTVIIRGSGFGDEPDESWDEWLGVDVSTRETSIVSWRDARIVVNCPDAESGDLVTVDALYGSDSAEIAGSDNPNKPPKKPKK